MISCSRSVNSGVPDWAAPASETALSDMLMDIGECRVMLWTVEGVRGYVHVHCECVSGV
jgi:hypothetical protein